MNRTAAIRREGSHQHTNLLPARSGNTLSLVLTSIPLPFHNTSTRSHTHTHKITHTHSHTHHHTCSYMLTPSHTPSLTHRPLHMRTHTHTLLLTIIRSHHHTRSHPHAHLQNMPRITCLTLLKLLSSCTTITTNSVQLLFCWTCYSISLSLPSKQPDIQLPTQGGAPAKLHTDSWSTAASHWLRAL